jgi:hypothetical protein
VQSPSLTKLGSHSWLEDELARELNPAGRARQALSLAEVAVCEVSVWATQTGMVEGVEHLGPELEIVFVIVAESSVLGELQVQILEAGIVYADRTRGVANLKGERLRENGWVEQEHGVIDAGCLGGEFRGRPGPVRPLVQSAVGRLSGPVVVTADQDRRTGGPVLDSRNLPAVDELALDRIPGAEELPAATEGKLIDRAR